MNPWRECGVPLLRWSLRGEGYSYGVPNSRTAAETVVMPAGKMVLKWLCFGLSTPGRGKTAVVRSSVENLVEVRLDEQFAE